MNASAGPAALAASAPAAPSPRGDESALSAERPFPGLRPFSFADRGFFFGRERQVYALYRLVDNGRFIAVIGSSGSGKSSLVLAGLRGLLAEETADPGGANWVCLEMRPGASPIARLAKSLAQLSAQDTADEAARRQDRIEYRLRQSSFSFESALQEAGGVGSRSLVLIVDQFEELFRFGLAGLGVRRAGIEETRARDEATQFVQILLDADRRRLEHVRVLITMRSDFIGDCAYFHGLSEAVSATQYLVPNLTRSQIEDAIRKPIEKAGATIEPELVERLLNDCGDEFDQLPVLQHCLMRLWDRAGAESAGAPRRLTRETYDDIGRMTDALSRHADEILRQCAGKELAVEQAFRALSEVDREGRAIRRALPFDQLLAESGVGESNLRAVLDKFRAPNCSFLVPPPAAAPTLAPDDRVDIGHETLLRRWKKMAGEIQTMEVAAGRPSGWLGKEQIDGQHYRTTLATLEDGEASGELATLNDPVRVKRWWDSLPRTAAWADRYGGRFADVNKLIDDNIAARWRTRRDRVLATVAIVACVLGAAGYGVKTQIDEGRRQREEAKLREEAIDRSAMQSAKNMLERVLQAYNNHTLDLAGARSLATVSEQFLNEVRNSHRTSAADSLWVQALDVESDLQATSGNDKEALELATKARDAARPLTADSRDAQERLQLLYDATIRVGNNLASSTILRFDDALNEYKTAVGIARDIVSLKDNETGEADLIDAHVKVGDIYHIRDREADALEEYRASLATCQAALAKYPQDTDLLRNQGKAYYRIAESYRGQTAPIEARGAYQQALAIQEPLVQLNPNDLNLKSNLAATYTHWGALERDAGDVNLALSKFEKGVALQEEALRKDPTNPLWETFLTPNYVAAADILQKLNRPKDALAYYQKAFDARRDLAIRTLSNPDLQEKFADAAKTLGDHSEGLDQIVAYRSATRTWKRLLDDPKSASAAAKRYDDVIGFARAFDAARDWPDAQTAYGLAQMIALRNFGKDSSDRSWKDKADEASALAAVAATSALRPPATNPPATAPP
jgi:tetratricopeptide (TPR) repeat protein/energy-coupling factor transporter ATP-binding protein EcfA2